MPNDTPPPSVHFTIYRDPAPLLVRYLRQRFEQHDSATLPEGLEITDYLPLGTTYPRLQVTFVESVQLSEGNNAFASTLELLFDPPETVRQDDDRFPRFDEVPEHIAALQYLSLEFLEDSEALAKTGVTILKQGTASTRVDEDNGAIRIAIGQTVQSYYTPPSTD